MDTQHDHSDGRKRRLKRPKTAIYRLNFRRISPESVIPDYDHRLRPLTHRSIGPACIEIYFLNHLTVLLVLDKVLQNGMASLVPLIGNHC